MTTPTQFPFDVRPFHRETLPSYSHRMLAANFCDDSHRTLMTRNLQTDNSAQAQDEAWLRVLAGSRRPALHLEPHPKRQLHDGPFSRCFHFDDALPPRFGCTLCSRGDLIEQHPHFDTIVCTKHHRWLGLWGNTTTQHQVDDDTVQAQRKFDKLRRTNRIDLRLYRLVVRALAETTHPDLPFEEAESRVFTPTIALVRAITLDSFARSFFTLNGTFAAQYELLGNIIQIATGADLPSVTRVLWIYLRPTMLALREAATTNEEFRPAWDHDYPIRPAVAAGILAFVMKLEPLENYLAVTGDTPVTAAQCTAKFNTLPAPNTEHARSFTCTNGHTFDYLPPAVLPAHMTETMFEPSCGKCTERRVRPGTNDVQTLSPVVASQFDVLRNGGLTAADVANSSSIKYWWTCANGHSHNVSPSKKTLRSYNCPICSNRTPRSGANCLLTTHPELAAMWADGWSDNLSPSTITAGSKIIATWRCNNGHLFRGRIHELMDGTVECRICKVPRILNYDDSLAATCPEAAERWHPEYNKTLTPRDVTRGERRWVWWLCEQGHVEKARIDKISLGQKCRVCSSRKLKKGFNDLATVEPVLSLELHPYLNRQQADEMFPSDHALHWKCLVNKHVHVQTTQNRRSSKGCPMCDMADRILTNEDRYLLRAEAA